MPPTLGYWKIRGLAQPIRLLLTYLGEDFEDVTYEVGDAPEYNKELWFSVKRDMEKENKLDFPNLPYYIDGDVRITQSNAILRYIARKHNLYGKTETDKANVDMLLETAMDFRNGTVRLCYNKDYERIKDQYFEKIKSQLISYDKKLGDKPWLAGDELTVADFPFYELLDQHKRMKADILEPYPKLKEFQKRFEALPKVCDYLKKEEVKSLPLNNKYAGFK